MTPDPGAARSSRAGAGLFAARPVRRPAGARPRVLRLPMIFTHERILGDWEEVFPPAARRGASRTCAAPLQDA